jgi:hypothetical protein
MQTQETPNSLGTEQPSLSLLLSSALDTNEDGTVTVGEVLDRVAERGFGFVMALLAVPTMIPVLPPGASAVVGAMFALLGLQLVFGLHEPWMPVKVRSYRLSERTARVLQTRGAQLVARFEGHLKPRMVWGVEGAVRRLIGLVVVALGVVLFLPLPFMNTMPGLALLVLGLGLAARDGRVAIAAAVLCLGLVLVVVFAAKQLAALSDEISGWARGLLRR